MIKKTYAFIDASNLFYGGEKSLGWKIDYLKLFKYLGKKYDTSKVFYFAGVETYKYKYDYLTNDTIPLVELKNYLFKLLRNKKLFGGKRDKILKEIQKIKFYLKLESFGFKLFLKPVKIYRKPGGSLEKKANCDVEMAFYLMKEFTRFDKGIVLSGDGDFLPVFKHLRKSGKQVLILARASRTAKEIKQFAGGNFRDFVTLRGEIEFVK